MVAFVVLAALVPQAAYAAGIDCKRGNTFVEKAICASPRLTRLDHEVANMYATATNVALRPDELRDEQGRWLRDVRNVCGDVACLRRVHEERLAELSVRIEREELALRRDPKRGKEKVCAIPDFVAPPDFVVLAAGGYRGHQLNFHIDNSGNLATHMEVTVHHPDKPVVLMLGAYDPTVWSVRHSAPTRIAAVFVSGYHRQVLNGVDGIPALNSSQDNQGPCGYFYPVSDGIQALNPIARRLVGKPAEIVYREDDGRIAVGEPLPAGVELVSLGLKPVRSFRDDDTPLSGVSGLFEGVRNGQLRDATVEDAKAWATVAAAVTSPQDVPPVAGQAAAKPRMPRLVNAYVVLQPFRLPAALYGRDAATFLIPKGVPRPTGNLGQSTMWDFNTGRCSGMMCDADGDGSVIEIEAGSKGVRVHRLK
jgi:hypothetical protein